MKVSSFQNHQARTATGLSKQVVKKNQPEAKLADTSLADLVTKGAYAAGGALGGVGLGVATGQVMSSLTGSDIFSSMGGVMGGLGGAVTALAVSKSDNKTQSMLRVFGGWAGSSAGSLAGQYVIGNIAQNLAAAGAAPWIGALGPLLGTAVGGLYGAALPLADADTGAAAILKHSAVASLAGTAGIGLGAAVQIAVANGAPALAPLSMIAPTLGAIALGSTALDLRNAGGKPVAVLAPMSFYGGIGYAVGMAIGGAVDSTIGTFVAPVSGLLTGAFGGYTKSTEDLPHKDLTEKAAIVSATTGIGTLVGELAGHGLTAVTGNSLYSQVAGMIGAANGAALGLSAAGVNTHKVTPTFFGASVGTATGALLGTALSKLTGQEIWGLVMPVLGATAGGLSAAAAAFNEAKGK